MIAIVAIDDKGGTMFNHRRQSQDRELRKVILNMTARSKLWMNDYSARQFRGFVEFITTDNDFLQKAGPGEYCFLEGQPIQPIIDKVEKLILVRWNRRYPGDTYLDVDVNDGNWELADTSEFQGYSHEKITMEVYKRK